MLKNLHVRNLALVREVDISFGDGLNIMTGETGAGKSVLIESIAAALGGRISKNMVRQDADYALAELEFVVQGDALKALLAMDFPVDEDGTLLITRRISDGRNTIRVNDESFTAAKLRAAAPYLIDIYGQNEHATLLDPSRQMALLDAYGKERIDPLKSRTASLYREAQEAKKSLAALSMGEDERLRKIDLLSFEAEEIEAASLRTGEDEELEADYRKLANGQKIMEHVQTAHRLSGYEMEGAGDALGNALRSLSGVEELDPELKDLYEHLNEIDSLLNDFNRELSDYIDSFSYDEEMLAETERRLDLVNHLKMKYGGSIPSVLAALETRQEELRRLTHYEEEKEAAEKRVRTAEKKLFEAALALREERLQTAARFREEVVPQLLALNFAQVDFAIDLREKEECGPGGIDTVEFMISTNPGEARHPLRQIASGGELSRIMLGIKAMFARKEEADTLIFDEIDTGISGRTAQKVAEKLVLVSSERQVLCITHLPQIAAMADHHFLIEKMIGESSSRTVIRELDEEGCETELARMLGGAEVTEQTRRAAAEMKNMAMTVRKERKTKS